ncbi:unnamed protein product [Symbiodinium sp. CCMP2592]|nr:unnamed protein product [Symbiodinium sp. CCMP2592]
MPLGCAAAVVAAMAAVLMKSQGIASENWGWLHLPAAVFPSLHQFLEDEYEPLVEKHEETCRTTVEEVSPSAYANGTVPSWPTVCRNCVSKEGAKFKVLQLFGNKRQDRFLPCEMEAKPVLGEMPPCLDVTLNESIKTLNRDKGWLVFTQNLRGDAGIEEANLSRSLGAAPELLKLDEISASPAVLALSVGNTTPVEDFHSHFDFFMFFNLAGTKLFQLLPPFFMGRAQVAWSGLSFVSQKCPKTSCIIEVVLQPGDVLVVDSWWLHRTVPIPSGTPDPASHMGYGRHLAKRTSLAGQLDNMAQRLFGPHSWLERLLVGKPVLPPYA